MFAWFLTVMFVPWQTNVKIDWYIFKVNAVAEIKTDA